MHFLYRHLGASENAFYNAAPRTPPKHFVCTLGQFLPEKLTIELFFFCRPQISSFLQKNVRNANVPVNYCHRSSVVKMIRALCDILCHASRLPVITTLPALLIF